MKKPWVGVWLAMGPTLQQEGEAVEAAARGEHWGGRGERERERARESKREDAEGVRELPRPLELWCERP